MKPVRIEDLFDYRFLSSVEISPSGEWAAFVAKHADVENNDYHSDVYLAHLTRPEVRRLTTSGKDGPFVWEASGDSILFASKRKEDAKGTALYRIRVTGGEAEFVFELPHKAEVFNLSRMPLTQVIMRFSTRSPSGRTARASPVGNVFASSCTIRNLRSLKRFRSQNWRFNRSTGSMITSPSSPGDSQAWQPSPMSCGSISSRLARSSACPKTNCRSATQNSSMAIPCSCWLRTWFNMVLDKTASCCCTTCRTESAVVSRQDGIALPATQLDLIAVMAAALHFVSKTASPI